MQLSQKLANFTKGQADSLRKAMGKKVKEEMDKLYTIYIDGCKANGHPEDKANKIWQDMEKFAQYAFNKSHSTCYALVAYHCAYLKAHYPSEFMAGLVSNNMDNIDEVGKYMQEAKKMGIEVLGPDVNESSYRFTVNKKGQIRFGLSALKGVGENLVKEMEENRAIKGDFIDIYDFVSRLGSTVVNKRALEPLAMGGAFDCFADIAREQYYEVVSEKEGSFIERLIRFSNSVNSSQTNSGNLFGDVFLDMVDKPIPPNLGEFNVLERLDKEKEVLGMYLSGHPLDPYRKIIEDCSFQNLDKFSMSSGTVLMAGMVSGVNIAIDKQGKRYGRFSLSNFNSKIDLRLKGDILLKYENFLKNGMYMIVKIKKDDFTPKDGGNKIEFDKIIDIYLLENAWEKVRRVDILIDAKILTANKILDLKTFFLEHKGKTTIYFNITDGVQVSDKIMAPKQGNSEILDEEGNIIEDLLEKEEFLEDEIQEEQVIEENPLKEALTFLSRNVLLDVSADSISKLEAIVGKENVKITISMD
jgi:DNA polymerase-3 subunit alpha